MNWNAKLEAFEGPLDLLLHLIEKNKIDIYDIPISEVTDQYLEYIRNAGEVDAELMSEFLVMAATLLDIKARMLLPSKENEEGEEEDPRAELVQKLLEYKLYKYMSAELKDRSIESEKKLYRAESLPEEVKNYVPPIDLDAFLGDLTLSRMKQIFDDVLARPNEKINSKALEFGSIQKEEVKIEERIELLRSRVKKGRASFRKLISEHRTRMNIIVTFLAILELMKAGELKAHMSEDGGDIVLEGEE